MQTEIVNLHFLYIGVSHQRPNISTFLTVETTPLLMPTEIAFRDGLAGALVQTHHLALVILQLSIVDICETTGEGKFDLMIYV